MAETITEEDRLHLLRQVADEVSRRFRVPAEELLAEGMIAMITAERRYNPKRGGFLPFVRRRVKGAMQNQCVKIRRR